MDPLSLDTFKNRLIKTFVRNNVITADPAQRQLGRLVGIQVPPSIIFYDSLRKEQIPVNQCITRPRTSPPPEGLYLTACLTLLAAWVDSRLRWLWFVQRLRLLLLLADCSGHGKSYFLAAALPPAMLCHPSFSIPEEAGSLAVGKNKITFVICSASTTTQTKSFQMTPFFSHSRAGFQEERLGLYNLFFQEETGERK